MRWEIMAAVGAPLHGSATMAYLPSQAGQEGGSYDDLESDQPAAFDISDYILSDEVTAPAPASFGQPESPVPPMVGVGQTATQTSSGSNLSAAGSSSSAIRSAAESLRTDEGSKIAFRTKSEVEILDDGFKWRKYGKKSVKNSPNPRNYYRCSTEGCSVKKRVERDKEDPSYVITTYEGTHNHMSPGVVYYTTQDSTSGRFYVAGCELPPGS